MCREEAKAAGIRITALEAIRSILSKYFHAEFPTDPDILSTATTTALTNKRQSISAVTAMSSNRMIMQSKTTTVDNTAPVCDTPISTSCLAKVKGEYTAFKQRYMIYEDTRGTHRPIYKEYGYANGSKTASGGDKETDKYVVVVGGEKVFSFPFMDTGCSPGGCPFFHPKLHAFTAINVTTVTATSSTARRRVLGNGSLSKPGSLKRIVALSSKSTTVSETDDLDPTPTTLTSTLSQLEAILSRQFTRVHDPLDKELASLKGTPKPYTREVRIASLQEKSKIANKLLSQSRSVQKEKSRRDTARKETQAALKGNKCDMPGYCECCEVRYSDVQRAI
jgi:hypothetical protein